MRSPAHRAEACAAACIWGWHATSTPLRCSCPSPPPRTPPRRPTRQPHPCPPTFCPPVLEYSSVSSTNTFTSSPVDITWSSPAYPICRAGRDGACSRGRGLCQPAAAAPARGGSSSCEGAGGSRLVEHGGVVKPLEGCGWPAGGSRRTPSRRRPQSTRWACPAGRCCSAGAAGQGRAVRSGNRAEAWAGNQGGPGCTELAGRCPALSAWVHSSLLCYCVCSTARCPQYGQHCPPGCKPARHEPPR